MAILRRDDTVQTAQGWAVPGAQVYYLEQPANVQTLTPLAQVYSDLSGTPAANPQITDGFGHTVAYLDNSQLYTIVWVSPVIGQIVYTDQNVGNAVNPISVSKIDSDQITGPIDGSNVTFSFPFASTYRFIFFWQNSAVLWPGVGFTAVQSGGNITVTLAIPPEEGDTLGALILG